MNQTLQSDNNQDRDNNDLSFDVSISYMNFDTVNKIFGVDVPKADMVYKPDNRWFMPEYHIKDATVQDMRYDNGTFISNWQAESVTKVFKKWYHKPFYWLWFYFDKAKGLFKR